MLSSSSRSAPSVLDPFQEEEPFLNQNGSSEPKTIFKKALSVFGIKNSSEVLSRSQRSPFTGVSNVDDAPESDEEVYYTSFGASMALGRLSYIVSQFEKQKNPETLPATVIFPSSASTLPSSSSSLKLTLSNNRHPNSLLYNHSASQRRYRRRAVLKNGDCNVVQVNISERRWRYLQDIFTTLVDAQWRWTLLSFVMSFVLSWLGFASMWWIIAYTHGDFLPENANNTDWIPCVVNLHSFISCFLYSIETQHSTGYGTRSPTEECPEAVLLVCIQSVTGVMIQAFMVGIVFAKMARPKQRTQTLLFSKHGVICQRDGQLCLQFRIGDMREKSHLINANVRVYLVRPRVTQEGEKFAPYFSDLVTQVDDYDCNIFMIWPMTVVHKIDIDSPLYKMDAADLLYEHFEIIVILEGTTESTGQTTQARTSYLSSEILWGHRFQPMVIFSKERLAYEVDYALFHNTYQVDTPLCSAAELDNLINYDDKNLMS